jgi:hypothetical protein
MEHVEIANNPFFDLSCFGVEGNLNMKLHGYLAADRHHVVV